MTNAQIDRIADRLFEVLQPYSVDLGTKYPTAWGKKTKQGYLETIKAILRDRGEVKA